VRRTLFKVHTCFRFMWWYKASLVRNSMCLCKVWGAHSNSIYAKPTILTPLPPERVFTSTCIACPGCLQPGPQGNKWELLCTRVLGLINSMRWVSKTGLLRKAPLSPQISLQKVEILGVVECLGYWHVAVHVLQRTWSFQQCSLERLIRAVLSVRITDY
jgi:hypothetical protein